MKTSLRLILATTALAASALTLTACSGGSTPSPTETSITNPVTGPIVVDAANADGHELQINVGDTLDINIGAANNPLDWSGKSSKPSVAKYTEGGRSDTYDYNPTVVAKKAGTAVITMHDKAANTDIEFTLIVE